jgi:uncharacterized protein YjbI with pentapeptide repeats
MRHNDRMAGDEGRPDYRVLSMRTIALAALALVIVGVGVGTWLLFAFGNGTTESANQLDAIKTAGTIVVGTGGAGALWLAARRQRTSEIALRQKDIDQDMANRAHSLQERVAAAAEADALERRVTELYTKAADQLGSDRAPVRLAGLYALERLANSTPAQRQTIVDVLCAYLRMRPRETDDLTQEQQVRGAALTVLATHLRREGARTFWADVDVDLSGAVLAKLDLTGCEVRNLDLSESRVEGSAKFNGVLVTGVAQFTAAEFAGHAAFERYRCVGRTNFAMTTFVDDVLFQDAEFGEEFRFSGATCRSLAAFEGAAFAGTARFGSALFESDTGFRDVEFGSVVRFGGTEFGGSAMFENVRFAGETRFDRASFRTLAEFTHCGFAAYVEFSEATFAGDTRFSHVEFADSARFATTVFEGDAQFTDARVRLDVPSSVVRAWPTISRAQPGRFDLVPVQEVTPGDEQWARVAYRRHDPA